MSRASLSRSSLALAEAGVLIAHLTHDVQHAHKPRSFRPEPDEYTAAKAQLDAHGRAHERLPARLPALAGVRPRPGPRHPDAPLARPPPIRTPGPPSGRHPWRRHPLGTAATHNGRCGVLSLRRVIASGLESFEMGGLAFQFVTGCGIDTQFVHRFVAVIAWESQRGDTHPLPDQTSHCGAPFYSARAVCGYVDNVSCESAMCLINPVKFGTSRPVAGSCRRSAAEPFRGAWGGEAPPKLLRPSGRTKALTGMPKRDHP